MIKLEKRLYLVRHGEVDFNSQGIMIGTIDQLLNAKGRQQTEKVAQKIKELPIDVLISSDLKRAAETAKVISEVIDIPLEIDPVFRERDYGSIEGRKKEDLKKRVSPIRK